MLSTDKTSAPWAQNDELFRELLRKGYEWQKKVAHFLLDYGLTIHIPPLRFRESYADIDKFKDDHDITVGATEQLWLEVKSSYLSWEQPSDAPDPMKLVTVSSWRKLKDKPFGIAIISKKTEIIIFAPTKFEDRWREEEIYDPIRGFSEKWLVCDHSCLFSERDLVRVLKARTR